MTRTINEDALKSIRVALSRAQYRIGQLSYSRRSIEPAFAAQIADELRRIELELSRLPVVAKNQEAATPAGKL